jgi:phenylalanyl-tRNA synthetase beta chain
VPQSVLRRDRVLALLDRTLSDAALEDILFVSKAELEAQDAETLTISVTPDRLDLLSEGGLGLYLQGATDSAKGIPPYKSLPPLSPPPAFDVDPSVERLRPAIAGVVVRAPEDTGLEEGTLAEAVRFQEIIHATVGRNRRAASLGIYPYDRLVPPFRYALEPMHDVRFVPLEESEEVSAERFFGDHPMAARYGALGRIGDACLTLRDSRGTVLSLPPILNGRSGGEARVGDRQLLLESTGLRDRVVRESLGLLSVVFTSRGWSVAPVATRRGGGSSSDGHEVLAHRTLDLPSATLHAIGGMTYPAGEVESRLARVRLTVHPHSGGWRVEIPPWRPDLLTATDLAEEVILAQAIRPEDGILPPSFTRGRRRWETVFRRRMATELLGLGYVAPYTSFLVSEGAVARIPGATPIRLSNPPSAEFAFLRDRLLLSHMEVLSHNTRHGYPQQVAEVAPVVIASPKSEAGAETRYHAGAILASETAGFADAAALIDYLLRIVDIVSVREPAELPGTIPGRAARVRVAGEVVAELGELRPDVLVATGVPVPVAWAELDLSALAPLLGRRDRD